MTIPIEHWGRFWSKVGVRAPNDCWEWKRAKDRHGYGQFEIAGKAYRSHRVAYMFVFGDPPLGTGYHGTCVLHDCDNRVCRNPLHLFIGTPVDNMQDCARKGRTSNARLTDNQVRSLRSMYEYGVVQMELAALFGLRQPTVSKIVLRLSYKHVA